MAGIYRSRVFNFINNQTNRFKNSLGQSWRQVKVSVQWTGQILLAPLRWLNWLVPAPDSQIPGQNSAQPPLQESAVASEISAAQIHQSPAFMSAADANQAIESLLATVVAAGHGLSAPAITHDDWSVIDENEWETTFLDENHRSLAGISIPTPLTPKHPVIQGLATLLSNQHLVLIDQHNQVLDILSPSQQRHIQQQIQPIMTPALQAAAAQLATTSPAAFAPAQPLVVVTPVTKPPNALQKMGYWCRYYLEYFQVDVNADSSAPSSALPAPLQKSWAITPPAITSISSSNTDSSSLSITTSGSDSHRSVIDIKTVSAQSQVDFQPKWIEAPSETLGYERSLLRQLWIWLDRLILKIENWVISIYQKLTQTR